MGRAKVDGGLMVDAEKEGRGEENQLGGGEKESFQGRGREDQRREESSQLLLINRGTGPQVENICCDFRQQAVVECE